MDEQKPETRTSVDTSQLSGAVTFGARGCLSTIAGLTLGAIAGVSFTVFLIPVPFHNWVEDPTALLIASVGGILGATLGALYGAVIGIKRR